MDNKKLNVLAIAIAGFCFNNTAMAYDYGSTQSGLDYLVDIIHKDPGLLRKVKPENITGGADSADGMNQHIIESIIATGVANDGNISTSDARELSDYIFSNFKDEWMALHGDDNKGVETGYHLVQNDGSYCQIWCMA